MQIAIDESGDSGKKFWKGSSRWFIVTAVIVPDDMSCGPTCTAVETYREEHNFGHEIHFARSSHERHVSFFNYVKDQEFIFVSVCIDKKRLLIKKPFVLRNKMSLLKYAFDKLFIELKPWLDNPIVLVDTNGSKQFNRSLSRYLIKYFGSNGHASHGAGINKIKTVDSSSEPLVQLADYVSGAVHHYVDGKHDSTTFQDYLENKGKILYIK